MQTVAEDGTRPIGWPPRGAWLVAGGLFVVLAAVGPRYGYHRDELYFLEAGRRPAWGYPDSPALVPLLAAAWDAVTGGRLGLFRLVPALWAATTVLVSAATSARLRGSPRDQVATALAMAVCAFAVAMGHLFSTSTLQLTLTATAVLLVLRALDLPDQGRGGARAWLPVGLVTGVALQVQTLPALVLASCLAGLLVAGPRAVLRTPWPWLAAVTALALAAPNLFWQAANGWPQLEVAADIAAGGSATSATRWQVVAFQLVIPGPLVAVVLVVGLVRLLRHAELRRFRWLAVGYLVLLVVVTVTGGKPYYTGALVPALLAAGVPPMLDAAARSRRRQGVGGALLAGQVAGAALISLPLAPPGSAGFVVASAANPDAAETVGWPALVAAVSAAAVDLPAGSAVVTANYGEAGALDRARRQGDRALPPVFSGHNAYGQWGPPPPQATTVLLVGDFGARDPARWFGRCDAVAVVSTGVDNEEDGAPVRRCSGLRESWTTVWPTVVHLG